MGNVAVGRPPLLKGATILDLVQGLPERKTVLGASTHALHVIYPALQDCWVWFDGAGFLRATVSQKPSCRRSPTVLQNFWGLGIVPHEKCDCWEMILSKTSLIERNYHFWPCPRPPLKTKQFSVNQFKHLMSRIARQPHEGLTILH